MLEWLDRRRRERVWREVIAGREAMADIYLATEREYHPLEEEIVPELTRVAESQGTIGSPSRNDGIVDFQQGAT
jgi:hypothetical protein